MLGLGRHARGRSGALHIDADDRRFDHARHADRLGHQRKAAAAGRAHRAATGVGRADDHVHHADLVLDLPDHDAELPRVRRHPHQHAGGRAHRISRIKFHARRRAAHGGGLVAGDDAQRLGSFRRLPRKRFEILRRVIVAGARDGDVLGHDRVALLLELPGNDRFERLRFDPEQLERGAERGGVDRQLVALGQFLHRHRAKLHAVGRLPGRDFLVVVNRARAGSSTNADGDPSCPD